MMNEKSNISSFVAQCRIDLFIGDEQIRFQFLIISTRISLPFDFMSCLDMQILLTKTNFKSSSSTYINDRFFRFEVHQSNSFKVHHNETFLDYFHSRSNAYVFKPWING